MNCSQWTLVILGIFLCLLIGSHGWIRFSDGHFNSAWQPMRRSSKCYMKGEACLQTSQCCSSTDVCLMDRKQTEMTGRDIGHCHNIDQYKGIMKDLKNEGEECRDSFECGIGLCCRAILRYRYGIVHRCGKSEGPFMCISKKEGIEGLYDVLSEEMQ